MCLRSNSQFALSNETFRIFKVSKKEKKRFSNKNYSKHIFDCLSFPDARFTDVNYSSFRNLEIFSPSYSKTLAIVVFLHNISSKETSKVSSISNRQRDLAATPSFLPNIPCESRCDFDQRRVTKRALVNERNQLNKNRTFSL